MSTLLVAYDLHAPGQKHANLLEAVKSYGDWAKLSESAYAISTRYEVQSVKEDLMSYIDDNDNLYVITLSRPWSAYGPKKVTEWLRNNL